MVSVYDNILTVFLPFKVLFLLFVKSQTRFLILFDVVELQIFYSYKISFKFNSNYLFEWIDSLNEVTSDLIVAA